MYDYIQYYGWENIRHEVVKENLSFSEAQKLEAELINLLDSIENGYNIKPGGQLGGTSWRKFEYNGKLYTAEELLQFSTVKNLTAHDITTRFGHGWDIDDILTKPKTQKNVRFEHNGKLYTSKELVEFSTVDGILPRDIFNRINNYGWEAERALTQPKNVKKQPDGCRDKSKECIFNFNGKKYKSYELRNLSDVDNISSGTITNRINQLHWSIEDAINKPTKKYNQKFEYNGNYYTSKELAKLSNVENITHHDITDRINRMGWSVERAITQPKRKFKNKKIT